MLTAKLKSTRFHHGALCFRHFELVVNYVNNEFPPKSHVF